MEPKVNLMQGEKALALLESGAGQLSPTPGSRAESRASGSGDRIQTSPDQGARQARGLIGEGLEHRVLINRQKDHYEALVAQRDEVCTSFFDRFLRAIRPDQKAKTSLEAVYASILERVKNGKTQLPEMPAHPSKGAARFINLPFEELLQSPKRKGKYLCFHHLLVREKYLPALQELFDAWHRLDNLGADHALRGLITDHHKTLILFDQRSAHWRVTDTSRCLPMRPRYTIYASTHYGAVDFATDAFTPRSLAFAHEVQHRFTHPRILKKLIASKNREEFDTCLDGNEFIAMQYERNLAIKAKLFPRISNKSNYVPAKMLTDPADPEQTILGLQIPIQVNGVATALKAGDVLAGRLVAADQHFLTLQRDENSQLTKVATPALVESLVPYARPLHPVTGNLRYYETPDSAEIKLHDPFNWSSSTLNAKRWKKRQSAIWAQAAQRGDHLSIRVPEDRWYGPPGSALRVPAAYPLVIRTVEGPKASTS